MEANNTLILKNMKLKLKDNNQFITIVDGLNMALTSKI